MIADHLEQLRPEDPDHRRAGPGQADDPLGLPIVERGAERAQRRPGHLGRLLGEAGVPRRLATAGLVGRDHHLVAAGPQDLDRSHGGVRCDHVGDAGDEQPDPHGGATLARPRIDPGV